MRHYNVEACDIRLKQSETLTWLSVDCRNRTLDDTSLRSVIWLLISWTKCHISQFVIVRTRCWNYASEYTPDRVLQAS